MERKKKRETPKPRKIKFNIKLKLLLCFVLMTLVSISVCYFLLLNPSIPDGSLLKPAGLGILIVVFLILVLLIVRITNSIIKPIRTMIFYLQHLAQGNTDFKIPINEYTGDIGQLAHAIRDAQLALKKITMLLSLSSTDIINGNLSIRTDTKALNGDYATIMYNNNKIDDSICDLIRNVRNAAENVASASEQMSSGAQALAQGATEQAASIEVISKTVTDLVDKTRKNSDYATTARHLSEEVNTEAENGVEKMKQLLTALSEINTASSNISNIIKVIEDIAFQTNILALNASVEAARAGIHGKGFAVVAEEVKNLANKSAQAAKETNALINESISKAKRGFDIGGDTENTLSNIVQSVSRAVDSISEIAEASAQQVETIDYLNTGIEQISQVVMSNTASAEESASSSQEMSAQAALLRDMVSHYKIDVECVVTEPHGWDESQY